MIWLLALFPTLFLGGFLIAEGFALLAAKLLSASATAHRICAWFDRAFGRIFPYRWSKRESAFLLVPGLSQLAVGALLKVCEALAVTPRSAASDIALLMGTILLSRAFVGAEAPVS